jgi:hypothetical protein
MRRLLVVACAALALLLACTSGELRGTVDDGGDPVCAAVDSFDALPATAGVQLPPLLPGGGVFVDLKFPPSRVAIADVFRPPQG